MNFSLYFLCNTNEDVGLRKEKKTKILFRYVNPNRQDCTFVAAVAIEDGNEPSRKTTLWVVEASLVGIDFEVES